MAVLSSPAGSAAAEAPPQAAAPARPAANSKAALSTVTIEAAREERKLLEHQVDTFVWSVMVHPWDKSLARWRTPVCPLVAGLPREQGEFVLARMSQIATSAHVPLAAERCRANLYVVVTPEPELLLKKWLARDARMFDDLGGRKKIRDFIRTPRPVRVWYNARFGSNYGTPVTGNSSGALSGSGMDRSDVPINVLDEATRLSFAGVQTLASVIVVVDTTRLPDLNVGQLADYVALVGLAEVHLEADPGSTATILRLFDQAADSLPPGLSDFDQALLKGLYATEQKSVTQMSQIETSMLKSIAP
jgi:hypothetical protein